MHASLAPCMLVGLGMRSCLVLPRPVPRPGSVLAGPVAPASAVLCSSLSSSRWLPWPVRAAWPCFARCRRVAGWFWWRRRRWCGVVAVAWRWRRCLLAVAAARCGLAGGSCAGLVGCLTQCNFGLSSAYCLCILSSGCCRRQALEIQRQRLRRPCRVWGVRRHLRDLRLSEHLPHFLVNTSHFRLVEVHHFAECFSLWFEVAVRLSTAPLASKRS